MSNTMEVDMNGDLELDEQKLGIDSKYFAGYEDLEIHELMLKDKPRQDAYHEAITKNQNLFKDKIVLDVGAGTGILSLMCANAGAKRVYAIEASSLVEIIKDLVEENGYQDVVKILHSKVEDVKEEDIEKVDVIISEWMGFYLLNEGMLDSVLYARVKFLKEGGTLFPEYAAIYAAPCSLPSLFEFWENVNGVKMTKFAEKLRNTKSNKPCIENVPKESLLHEGVLISWLDLNEVTLDDVDEISATEVIAIQKEGNYQGICLWFTCKFPSDDLEEEIVLSTSTLAPPTHWKQTVVALPENACENVGVGDPIAFKLDIKRNVNDKRKYTIEVELLDPEEAEHPLPCDCIMTKCILAKQHLATME